MLTTRESSDSAAMSGRRVGSHIATSRRDSYSSAETCAEQDAWDAYYKDKPDYREFRIHQMSVSKELPGWAIAQIGFRIVSLFLSGVVAGCSIRGYLTGLVLWLPLVAVIVIWEVAELLVFAANRTHGINPTAHIIMELIIALGALAYTGLSIWEVFVFRGYRSIVEFAVVTGLLAAMPFFSGAP
ncbi:hypothetical protein JX265_003854 [Neoarthrinium moseri]|uniref:Uncharacterized protein n=1 Tax=Neoarthrinium moseri TaxID=1658444 RepID=A0A9P9WR95_9PEZI|nr:uncharacterized protein JN550_009418 [Neoarthrinium moseri]KAI1863718.1 hypothetical protein JN550_009418 [Neoarthrinium moseri]KAI1876328.1 hypothetical protein JX265_003854 [Neoarthrinium moseri]